MQDIWKKYSIYALLNLTCIDVKSVITQCDNLTAFYSNLNRFLAEAPRLIAEIQEKLRTINSDALQSELDKLSVLFSAIGATKLTEKMCAIDKLIQRRLIVDRNFMIGELGIMISDTCKIIKTCQSTALEINSNQKTVLGDSTKVKLSQYIEKSLKNSKPNILVVDDVPIILSTAISILDGLYAVHCLPRATMVSKLLRSVKIDLFILDIEMPGMDGYELFKAIRELPLYKDTPILFFTSHTEIVNIGKAATLGAAGYLSKPVDPEILKSKIKQCLVAK